MKSLKQKREEALERRKREAEKWQRGLAYAPDGTVESNEAELKYNRACQDIIALQRKLGHA